MARKRRKKEIEKEITPLPPETKVEEIIEEYKDYMSILEHESIPLSEPIELPKTRKIKYLGTVDVFIIKGPVTKQRYRFTTRDRISEVATEDYDGLLKRVRPARKCCGRKAGDPGRITPSQPYFGPA